MEEKVIHNLKSPFVISFWAFSQFGAQLSEDEEGEKK